MTLEDAKGLIGKGLPFGEVYPLLREESEREQLRAWFVNNETLPNLKGRAGIACSRQMGYTGSSCKICQGVRMIRVGTCERCEDCGETSGGCG